jgi:hypothetical protein
VQRRESLEKISWCGFGGRRNSGWLAAHLTLGLSAGSGSYKVEQLHMCRLNSFNPSPKLFCDGNGDEVALPLREEVLRPLAVAFFLSGCHSTDFRVVVGDHTSKLSDLCSECTGGGTGELGLTAEVSLKCQNGVIDVLNRGDPIIGFFRSKWPGAALAIAVAFSVSRKTALAAAVRLWN